VHGSSQLLSNAFPGAFPLTPLTTAKEKFDYFDAILAGAKTKVNLIFDKLNELMTEILIRSKQKPPGSMLKPGSEAYLLGAELLCCDKRLLTSSSCVSSAVY